MRRERTTAESVETELKFAFAPSPTSFSFLPFSFLPFPLRRCALATLRKNHFEKVQSCTTAPRGFRRSYAGSIRGVVVILSARFTGLLPIEQQGEELAAHFLAFGDRRHAFQQRFVRV